jgi:transposase InsO family protein
MMHSDHTRFPLLKGESPFSKPEHLFVAIDDFFVNYYNTVKPHKGIGNLTPMEKLINYFYPKEL